jgi:hypothetical protein
MCIIAVCNDRKMTDQEFEYCWGNNSDGVGMGYATPAGKIVYVKGFMEQEQAWDAYRKITRRKRSHVVHFRKKSAGEVCQALTHPFIGEPMSPIKLAYAGTKPIVFHNGTHPDYESIVLSISISQGRLPVGAMSDTRALAMLVGVLGVDALKYAKGKFAVITPKQIITYGDFTEEDGIEFSNTDYKYKPYTYAYSDTWKRDKQDPRTYLDPWSGMKEWDYD